MVLPLPATAARTLIRTSTPWVDYVPMRLDDDDSSLVAALERLAGNATLRSYISRNANCFWKRHFGYVDDIMRRFVCGLSARQRHASGS